MIKNIKKYVSKYFNINIYSRELLPIFKEAGYLANSILKKAEQLCESGITTLEIDKYIETEIYKNKAIPIFKGYENFPNSSCISVNEYMVHGIPGKYKLKNGDVVKIDLGLKLNGLSADNALTTIVGNRDNNHIELLEITKQSVINGIKEAIIGNTTGDIGRGVLKTVISPNKINKHSYTVFYKFEGHGIGLKLHEPPAIPSCGYPKSGIQLVEGMCICIEPVVMYSSSKIIEYKDNKYGILQFKTDNKLPSAHFETQIYISKEGPIILTVTP